MYQKRVEKTARGGEFFCVFNGEWFLKKLSKNEMRLKHSDGYYELCSQAGSAAT